MRVLRMIPDVGNANNIYNPIQDIPAEYAISETQILLKIIAGTQPIDMNITTYTKALARNASSNPGEPHMKLKQANALKSKKESFMVGEDIKMEFVGLMEFERQKKNNI